MAKSLTVKDIKSQIEHVFGRQPEKYMFRLINDGLNEIASKRQHRIKLYQKLHKDNVLDQSLFCFHYLDKVVYILQAQMDQTLFYMDLLYMS